MKVNDERRIVIDLDGVLARKDSERDYADKIPDKTVIERLREYSDDGFYIIISTARNMRTYEGRVGKINAETAPTVIDWLDEHNVPYDEIHYGKPWCGYDGFYIDDNAIRPGEFIELDHSEIQERLASDSLEK